MSISKQSGTDSPSNKRRKLSNGEQDDERLKAPISSAGRDGGPDLEGKQHPTNSTHGSRKAAHRPKSPPTFPTGGLNKSSVLTIQLSELLLESTPSYDTRIAKIEPVVERIKSLIREVPKTGMLGLKDAENFATSAGVSIPFSSPKPTKDTNLKFQYDSPEDVDVKSALHLKMSIKGAEIVKTVVQMPKSLLQEKDYLNHRAFHKRAFYLACVAVHMKKAAPTEFDLQYAYDDGVDLLPGLLVSPKNASAPEQRRYTMMIVIGLPKNSFTLERTSPIKNCVRPKDQSSKSEMKPTPAYNSILNSQASLQHYQELLRDTAKQCASFADACRAGQIWLRQRGFGSQVDCGGFGFWEWALISALLLRTGGHKGHAVFSERYNSLQLFKAMLQVLSGKDVTEPWVLNTTDLTIPGSDMPILYDGKTGVNLLHKMTPGSYQALRHHARISLESVNSKQDKSFEATFDRHVSEPQLQFDEIYSIEISLDSGSNSGNQTDLLNRLYRVLKRGLGDRVTILDLFTPAIQPWSTKKPRPASTKGTPVELRLLLSLDVASRLIDHGPSADDQDAAEEFRRFWGQKSDLRRFKDGSISESLVWSPSKSVTEQIIEWLLNWHFEESHAILVRKSAKLEDQVLGTDSTIFATEAFRLINSQFQILSSTLHQLEGLPLPIRSISPTDCALRSCTQRHPLLPNLASPISILIQFDSSTRWPDSLAAIQHTKIAFLLKLADLLSSSSSASVTRVGLENASSQHSGYLSTSFLDITYPPPHPQLAHITFRLRIHHDRELPLLQAQVAKSLSPAERSQITPALPSHKRTLASPLHTTTFRTLATRFSPLAPTIRLLKSFLASHHLSTLIPPELIELVVAHVFLHPSPWSVPGSASTAFLRCLHFLARWDWQITPLIVDLTFSRDMTDAAREDLRMRFMAWRKLDPQMSSVSWFVGTNIDETGVVWSEGGRLEKVVAGRVRALAQAATQLVSSKGTSMTEADWGGLFHGGTEEFDFVIRLNKSVLRGPAKQEGKTLAKEKAQQKFKNLVLAQQSLSPNDIGFDPISLYLSDLQNAFGHVVLFFYGEGKDVVCGLWRPNGAGEREWRVRLGWSSVPVRYTGDDAGEAEQGKKVTCTINRDGMLSEMAVLGDGMVKDIKVRSEE